MKLLMGSTVLFALLALSACSSAEQGAAPTQTGATSAQPDMAEQRLELIEQYRECVRRAGGVAGDIEACDTYLNAAAALQ